MGIAVRGRLLVPGILAEDLQAELTGVDDAAEQIVEDTEQSLGGELAVEGTDVDGQLGVRLRGPSLRIPVRKMSLN